MRRRAPLLLPLFLILLACRTIPLPVGVSPPRKVVMVSLDGADAATLHRLHREGKLAAGGFARFFREGQVADALVPVNPSVTSSNHISLVTGYLAGETGIVGNDIRLPGMSLTKMASGFAVEIGTETLWEAARRQGRRAVSIGWPGADGRGPRRTPDWGMTYSSSAARHPELRIVHRGEWTGPLEEGEWALVACGEPPAPSAEAAVRCWAKVLEAGPESVRVYFGGVYRLGGYPESFDAALQASGLVWPGPGDSHRLEETWAGRPGMDLDTWVEQEERFSAFFLDALLLGSRHSSWDLLLGYMPVLDDTNHELLLVDPRQPGYSPERRDAFEAARLRVWLAVDRQLARLLDAVDLRTTTVLIVSDHGMAPAHTLMDVDALLREWGMLAVGPDGSTPLAESRADGLSGGGVCHIYLQPGLRDTDRLAEEIRSRLLDWSERNGRPIARVLRRREAAEVGMDHANLGELLLFAEPGWTFRDEEDPVAAAALSPTHTYGKHGYLNTHPAMHGIYMAVGAGVEKGSAGTVRTEEVAGRVARWLGMEAPRRTPVRSEAGFRQVYRAGTRDAAGHFMGGTTLFLLASHAGRLWASTGYSWDVPGDDPATGAQVLVLDRPGGEWRVDLQFDARKWRASLDAIAFTTDGQGRKLPEPVSMLVSSPTDRDGRIVLYGRDDAMGAWTPMPLGTSSKIVSVRGVAVHRDRITGVDRVFAGTFPNGVVTGVYDPGVPGRIRWETTPELTYSEMPMGFAECGGDLYLAAGPHLYRRVDGESPRWEVVYTVREPLPKGSVGLRGLTAVPGPDGGEVLLAALDGNPARILRIHPERGHEAAEELDVLDFLARQWGRRPTFAIPAYNGMTPVTDPRSGETVHLMGLAATFAPLGEKYPKEGWDPGGWYLVRRPGGCYELRRIVGDDLPKLVATRQVMASPFGDSTLYFAGYDPHMNPSHNTAWVFAAPLATALGDPGRCSDVANSLPRARSRPASAPWW